MNLLFVIIVVEIKAAAADIVANTDQEDPFLRIIPPFVEQAVEKLSNIRNDLLVAEKVYEELLKYFGSAEDGSELFFGYFSSFAVNFRNYTAKMQHKKAIGRKIGGAGDGGSAADPMDSIIANIKAGKQRKAQQQ